MVAKPENEIRKDNLNEQIEKTSITDLQQVFFNLIEEQTKVILLAKVSDEYLFKTIDPAVIPEEKTKPRRLLIVGLGLFLGGIVGAITALATARARVES